MRQASHIHCLVMIESHFGIKVENCAPHPCIQRPASLISHIPILIVIFLKLLAKYEIVSIVTSSASPWSTASTIYTHVRSRPILSMCHQIL